MTSLLLISKVFLAIGIVLILYSITYAFQHDLISVISEIKVVKGIDSYEGENKGRYVFENLLGKNMELYRGATGTLSESERTYGKRDNRSDEEFKNMGFSHDLGIVPSWSQNSIEDCIDFDSSYEREEDMKTPDAYDDEATAYMNSDNLNGGMFAHESGVDCEEETMYLNAEDEEETMYLTAEAEEETRYLTAEEEATEYLGHQQN